MKPILLATDYSPAARNAGDYAAQLALTGGTSLVVLHSWAPPAPMGETPVAVSITELEDIQQSAVQSEADRLAKTWGVKTTAVQRMGFAAEEMQEYAKENNVELMVMGMHETNALGRLLGSVATASLHRMEVPALIIPEGVKFHAPSTILLATDLNTERDWNEIEELEQLSKLFNFDIHVINVVREEQVTTAEESRSGIRLENRMKDHPHTWHFPVDDNILHAIGTTSDKVNADWIAVVPHHLPWYKDLFHSSVSRRIAFSTSRPLLALTGKS